jgi:ADP-ribose pyrophosphatase YjhB (NUDIX family)
MSENARRYPSRPIPCAAAIVMRDESVLLVQRGKEPNYGRWTFPGGAIELGETSRECATRETFEETGLIVEILDVAFVVDRIFREEDGAIQYQYFIVDYLARPSGGTLKAATDVLSARWVPFDETETYDLAPPSGEALRKAIEQWRSLRNSPESA